MKTAQCLKREGEESHRAELWGDKEDQKAGYRIAAWVCNHSSDYKLTKNPKQKEHLFECFTEIICFKISIFRFFPFLSLQSDLMWKLRPRKAVQLQYPLSKTFLAVLLDGSQILGHRIVHTQGLTLQFFW